MKDEKYWNILNHAVRLEVTKGHLRWTMTDLSRASGVGRTLIYHYFGKTKESIIQEALKLIADEVFGLSTERLQLWQEGRIQESVSKSRELLEKAPHLREFYIHWRQKPSEVQEHLIQVEKRYTQKLKLLKKDLSADQAKAIFAVLFGLVMTPELNIKTIELVLAALDILSPDEAKNQ